MISTFKIYFETWKFFHKFFDKSCLKVRKFKKSEFQKLYVRRRKLTIIMWFPFNFAKNLKDRHFVVGWSKKLKLAPDNCFLVSFQKSVLSSLLLFLSDISDSERNKVASSTARNFSNSWLLYVSNFQKQ